MKLRYQFFSNYARRKGSVFYKIFIIKEFIITFKAHFLIFRLFMYFLQFTSIISQSKSAESIKVVKIYFIYSREINNAHFSGDCTQNAFFSTEHLFSKLKMHRLLPYIF